MTSEREQMKAKLVDGTRKVKQHFDEKNCCSDLLGVLSNQNILTKNKVTM